MTAPALPDLARLTSYSIVSPSVGPFSCGFDLYADSDDPENWVEIWLDGVQQVGNWTLDSATGSDLSILDRPITNGRITFSSAITGSLKIVGARRPRRTVLFTNGQAIPAEKHNLTYNDMMAVMREFWDLRSRMFLALPGAVGAFISGALTGVLSSPATTTDNAVARWNGTSGAALQDSPVTISDAGLIAGASLDTATTATTQSPGDNTTKIATTGFVKAAIDVVLGGVSAAFDTLSEIATELGLKAPLDSPSIANFVELSEISSPSNPAANKLRIFAKDSATVTKLYIRDSSGTETELAGAGGADVPVLIAEYNSGQFGELVTNIPIDVALGPLNTILRIPIEVEAGDILFAAGSVEFTHTLAYNFSTACVLAVGPAADFSSYQSLDLLDAYTFPDITGDQHHVLSKAGSISVVYSGIVYVGFLAYASSSAAGASDVINIESGANKLSVLHYRLPAATLSTYTANAVNFDGTNDYLTRGAGLDGAADAKTVTISAWVKRASDTNNGVVVSSATTVGGATTRARLVYSNTTNRLEFAANDAAGNLDLHIRSTNDSFQAADGWVHFLASVDMADVAKRHLYINDVSDLTVVAYVDDTLDFTQADWSIGAHPDGSVKDNVDIAEVWLSFEYIDLSVAANRRLFITAGGKPAYMGPNGILAGAPSGGNYRLPDIYMKGSTSTWHLNRGKGGPFAVTGALTTAATSPSS